MTLRRKLADLGIAGLSGAARLLGPRFYRLYLDDVNRRQNDAGDVAIDIAGRSVSFACPNQVARWRVDTLFTKEPATIAWIDGFAEGDVFWDIGANVGVFSLYAAVARKAKVVAVEPLPANFAVLARNVSLNRLGSEIAALAVALSSHERISGLATSDEIAGSSDAQFGGDGQATWQTLGLSIDRLIAGFGAPFPKHIKIDVDGGEGAILAGATATLADPRLESLSIEIDRTDGGRSASIRQAIEAAGFRETGMHVSPLYPDSPAANVLFRRDR